MLFACHFSDAEVFFRTSSLLLTSKTSLFSGPADKNLVPRRTFSREGVGLGSKNEQHFFFYKHTDEAPFAICNRSEDSPLGDFSVFLPDLFFFQSE